MMSLFSLVSYSKNSQEKGLEIATKVQDANNQFLGEINTTKMILIDAYGAQTVRKMKGKILEVENDGDKSLSTFLEPLDVKGTKMLTWSHKQKNDDQWLYLPSLRRVKRISSSGQSSSFMGSEFSFEDLGSQEVEKFTYNYLKDETLGDSLTWVLERTPIRKSGYSKQIVWTSKKMLTPLKIEYFDRREKLLKTAVFSDFKEYSIKKKKMFRANKIHMKNIQTKKESIFLWETRSLGSVSSSREFMKRSLK
ncbi:MAG: outer membrane lipoprotein-sorting protein [Halobacteriovoraceae bacterium]|nr:outer membrane lipoprotein-sorting protein [Halobacteriovoraceae bacterium]